MAGDWIKWTKGLARRREVLGIASRLSISPAHAAGLCMLFWEWLDDNVTPSQIDENGNAFVTLGTLRHDFIDALVGVEGFASALTDEGWIHSETGYLVVPNYCRHNSQTAKARALTAERVCKSRRKKCNGLTVTPVTVKTLPEKRREDNNKKTSSSYNTLPSFSPPSLEEVQAYCRERNNQVDPQLFIDHYTSNGWVVGKAKMKDWRAAVRTWEKNNFTAPAARTARAIGPGQRHPSDLSDEEGTF